jgi:CheY-like chemotaxis protein
MFDKFTALIDGLPPAPLRGSKEVLETSELRRIREAQRARWQDAVDLAEGTRKLTAWLKMPGGSKELKQSQAATLRALHDRRGAFCPLLPGEGKSLIAMAAPTVVPCKRPLMLVPANARSKTLREHARDYAPHFRLLPLLEVTSANRDALERVRRGRYPVVSYQSIAASNWENFLTSYAPDLIVLDECHMAKSTGSKVTRRLSRFVRATTPVVLAMSGSIENRSLREYAHVMRWCLGDASPLPRSVEELQRWCWAIDEKVADGARLDPGALLTLSPPNPEAEALLEAEGTHTPLNLARLRYGDRLTSTAGVVASSGGLPPIGLNAEILHVPADAVTQKYVNTMRATWETPCGLPFEQALELWRHEREMSCGLYQRWREQPPAEWLGARKAWSAGAREKLQHSKKYDSAMDLANALDRGELIDPELARLLADWRAVRDMFKPATEPVWFSEVMLHAAAQWLAEENQGICWVHHAAFGARLSQMTGLPYFSTNAADARGRQVDQVSNTAIIASIQACGVTWNLQHHSRNLVITCPTTGRMMEQMIARTHRPGQEADEVALSFARMLEGDGRALEQAKADALNIQIKTRQPQRILAASWLAV